MPDQNTELTATTVPASDAPDRLVPVTEAIRYRKRAQQAEAQLAAQSQEVEDLRRQLGDSRDRLETLERRTRLDAVLADAGADDLDAARTLAEAALASMETPDPRKAVDELRRRKPYLFHTHAPAASVMGPRVDDPAHGPGTLPTVEHAAQQARATGDRRDLLAYLRLRRTK